ncbi:MAG: hypothetical protein Q9167_000954 [Letrouitia subvulpina]
MLQLPERIVEKGQTPVSTTELVKETHADPLLLERILHFMASTGMVTQVDDDTWTASNITKALAVPGVQHAINHHFETSSPALQVLPRFLESTKFQNPADPTDCALSLAFDTHEHAYQWFPKNPDRMNWFVNYMAAQREGEANWLDSFPFQDLVVSNRKPLTPERPTFVDVGGGIGHQSRNFKAHFPDLPGRVILQDSAKTIDSALKTEGVEPMAHNFFNPQPIQGARAYYLRNVLHNWPDEKCVAILKQIIAVLDEDSVILIDEKILPNQNMHWQATGLDLVMMAALASLQRTEKQWKVLLDAAGLRIENLHRYHEESGEGVLVAVPK